MINFYTAASNRTKGNQSVRCQSFNRVKRFQLFAGLLSIVLLLFFNGVNAQVSVTATAGTIGPTAYSNLNSAFTAINAGTHQGVITIKITANTTEPATPTPLLTSGGTSSYTSISIMPSGNVTVNSALVPTASRGIIELHGADNVTIDGDDPGTTGTRNLTIAVATNASTGTAAIVLGSKSTTGLDGATNNTIKNCLILGGRNSATATTSSYGIVFSNNASSTSITTAGAYSNNNITILNNDIRRCYQGISATGASATYPNNTLKIQNNIMGSSTATDNIGSRDILISYTSATAGATSALIEGNDMRAGDVSASGTGYSVTIAGIEIGTVNAGATVRKNNIHDIMQPNTGGYGAYGISITGSATNDNISIYNNFIRDIVGSKYSTSLLSPFENYGIYISAGATLIKINFNTIAFLVANSTGTTSNSFSACIGVTSSATISQFQNNILVNNNISTAGYCFYTGATTNISGGTINNNDYYAPSGSVGYYNAGTQTTLAAWQTATGKDGASVSTNPPFVSATDLHLIAGSATQLESGGTSVAGITDDYDGQTRGATTPDIGADEFTGTAVTGVTINSVSISPTGNQCTATGRTVSATITAGSSNIISVVLKYSLNGGAPISVTMTGGTVTAGTTSTWTAPIPASGNSTVTWSVTATDATTSKTTNGTSYQDAPLTGVTATAAASPNPVCSGNNLTLTGSFTGLGSGTIGSGTSISGSSSVTGTLYPSYYGNGRQQYIILASELAAQGFSSGNLTSLKVTVNSIGSPATLPSYTIKLASTSAASFASATFLTPTFSTVYGPSSYTPVIGVNTHNFTTPFNWDGTSNIVVEICFGSGTSGSSSTTMTYTSTSFTSVAYFYSDVTAGCGQSAISTTTLRPNITFTGNKAVTSLSYAWSLDGTNFNLGSGNPLTINPTSDNTYYVKGTDANGCSITSSGVTVTVNPLPTAPTGINSAQCGAAVPTASVSDPNGFTTPTFKWYSTNTSTTALQSSISTTYTTSISVTTTFFVSVVNPATGCESARTSVTVTVTNPDAVTAKANGSTTPATVCPNTSVSLTAEQAGTNNIYSFTWTANPQVGSGIPPGGTTGQNITVTPTTGGTYAYTVTASDGICTTTSTVSLTVTPPPTISSATATPSTSCAGSNVTLTATTPAIGAGTAVVGAGGTTQSGSGLSPFAQAWEAQHTQYLILASDLTSAGLVAGNLTSLKYTISTKSSTLPYANYAIKIGSTSATTLTALLSPTFTSVYSTASYSSVLGANTFTFSAPYNWNGTSNIVIDICFANDPSGTGGILYSSNDAVTATTKSYTAVYGYYQDNANICGIVGTTSTSSAALPVITFGGQVQTTGSGSLTWTWNPGGLNGNTVTVNPLLSTTYTVTAYNPATTCSNTATVSVTVNPVPTAPTGTNSTQCGTGVPTASVSDPNGFASPIFKWYADNSTLIALQSGTSNTYTTSISSTTTFYVSVLNSATGCESSRIPVTVTVTQPDAVTAKANGTAGSASGCLNSGLALTAVQTGTTNTYSFTWTANPQAGSGIPAGGTSGQNITVTPSVLGTYVYTVTATDGLCTTTNSVTVIVNSIPPVTASASPSTTCSGGPVTLTASSSVSGTAAIGTQTTTEFGGGVYRYGYGTGDFRHEMLFKASELTSAGFVAGNLTAITFNVTSLGNGSASNYTIKLANSAATVLTTTFQTATFTTVYTAATYTPVSGNNVHTFTTPFNWDGTSNILIDICYTVTSTGSTSTLAATTPSFIANTNLLGTTGACTATTGATTYANRPLTSFTGQLGTSSSGSTTYTWNPGNLTGSTVTVNPTANTTYTVTANNTSTNCSNTGTVSVTIGPIFTASVNSPTICSGTSTTLTATTSGAGAPFTHQWSTGATTASITVSPTSQTTYTDNITDVCGNVVVASGTVFMNPFYVCYCTAGLGGSCTANDISNVAVQGTTLNSNSTCTTSGTNAYTSFPAAGNTTAILARGFNYTFSVTSGSGSQVGFWIDYNQNGVFDASEYTSVTTNSGGTPSTVSITIPATALTGITGMRVRSSSTAIADVNACSAFTLGETEDYLITISTTPACNSKPSTSNTLSSANPVCANSPFVLSLSTSYTLSGITFQWQKSTDGGATYTTITGATNATYNATQTTTTYYRAVVACTLTPGDSLIYSSPIPVNMNTPAYAVAPYVEDFEESPWLSVCATDDVPNNNWNNIPSSGNNSWRRDDDGSSAGWTNTSGAYTPAFSHGAHSARFHSKNAVAGTTGDLDLYIDLSAAGTKTLTFDYINTSGSDNLKVYLSTDGGVTFGAATLSLTTASAWTNESVAITATSATSVIRFEATSDNGASDIGIDNLILFAPCTGSPFQANAQASPSSVCSTTSFTLSIDYTYPVTGLTYQWQKSTDGSTFTNISGATNTTYTTTQSVTTIYQLVVTCTASGQSTTSNQATVQMNPFTSCYCTSNATSTADEEILKVTFGTLSNTSTCATTGGSGSILNKYSNFTGLTPPDVEQAASIPFSVQVGTCGGTFTNAVAIYIDYNQNGLFSDAGEQVYLSAAGISGPHTESGNITIPVSALLGITQMRVISMETSTPSAISSCGTYSWGETEDYYINITAAPFCTGKPAASTTLSSVTSACSNTPFTLSLGTTYAQSGTAFQWQSSSDGINFTDISGATNLTYAASQTAPTWYQAVITCTNTGDTTQSQKKQILMNNFLNCYCTSNATSTVDEDIFNVTLGTLNNTSTCSTTGGAGSLLNKYSNYTGVTAPLVQQGSATAFSVQIGTCNNSYTYTNGFKIYIDYNQNGSFSDANELVYTSPFVLGNHTESGTITVPVTATTGTTQMRVVSVETSSASGISPCGTYTYGETEDYYINITAAPDCGSATGGTITPNTVAVCASNTATTLTATGIPALSGFTYQWLVSSASGSGYVAVTGGSGATTSSYTTPNNLTGGTYYYVLQVTCTKCGSCATALSNEVAVTVNDPMITGTTPAARCGTGTVNLQATSTSGSTVNWYTAATGGTPLASGNSFTTPSISTTTTFYASASVGGTSGTLGPVSPSIGAFSTSFTGSYEIFDVTSNVTLNSVDVYATAAGNVIVTVLNSSGTVLQTSATVTITAAQANSTSTTVGTPITIPLGFALTPGTSYRLNYASGSTATLLRNSSGATATYGPVNGVTITGNSNATTGYYYNFYNWSLSSGCESARTAVVATVTTPPAITSATATPSTICAGQSTVLSASSTSNPSYTFVWNPGNLPNNTSVTPTGTTTYTVTATDNTNGTYGGCSATATATVVVNPLPVISSATATPGAICPGGSAVLSANSGSAGSATIGTSTSTELTNSPYRSGLTPSTRTQYLFTAAELSAAGVTAGSITSISWNVTSAGSGTMTNYTISIAPVTATSFSSTTFLTGTFTTVYTAASYNAVVGTNLHTFNTPFTWDGTSNIVVNLCYDVVSASGSSTVSSNTTAFVSVDQKAGFAGACSLTTGTTGSNRPLTTFGYNSDQTSSLTFTWNPGNLSGASVTVTPNGTTTYTVTAKNPATTCTSTATVSVTVNPNANAGTISGASSVCVGLTTTLTSNGDAGGSWSSDNTAAATVSSTGVVTGVSAGSATITYSVTNTCGTATATKSITVNPNANAGTISGASSVCAGLTTTLSSNGDAGGAWSSGNTAVATVGTSGVVTGVSAGTATITYSVTNTCGTATATKSITVNPNANAGIISGASSVCVGLTTTLTSNGDAGGSWTSNNTSVATVNSSGVVTGVSAGSATISYTVTNTCGTATATKSITVNPNANAGIISGASSVCAGATTTLSSNGDAGGPWSSDNTAVATVSSSGVVTGVSTGTATISYTVTNTCGTATATKSITVNPNANAGTISGASSVCVGLTTTLTSNGDAGGTWSSDNTAVATVSTSGVVTGVSAGSATITYTVTNTCGTATATKSITVNPNANAGTISGASSVCVGLTTTLTSNGDAGGSWSSDNTAVATVSTSGVVTGVSAGTATITYQVTNTCGTASTTKLVTVNPNANAGTISGTGSVCIGTTTTLTSNGDAGGTWTSGNTAVATVNASGVVTGVSTGTATITYSITNTCGTATATKSITVNPNANAGTISGSGSVCSGATTTLSSNGDAGGTWTSDNTAVATVSTSGVVTGVSAGSATITYSVTNTCGTATATKSITVNPNANAGTISGTGSVCIGTTTTLTSNGDAGGTWTSDNTAVATVNASGVVT